MKGDMDQCLVESWKAWMDHSGWSEIGAPFDEYKYFIRIGHRAGSGTTASHVHNFHSGFLSAYNAKKQKQSEREKELISIIKDAVKAINGKGHRTLLAETVEKMEKIDREFADVSTSKK